MEKTEEFYRFYRDKMLALDAKPNAAHLKLAELEAKGKLKAVVTQNIDGLHQAAGSKMCWSFTAAYIAITAENAETVRCAVYQGFHRSSDVQLRRSDQTGCRII